MIPFQWVVSRSGYAWDWRPGGQAELVTYDAGTGVWPYRPMEENRGLCMEFAALTSDREYLRFAARYGHLTTGVRVVIRGGLGGRWDVYLQDAIKHDRPRGSVPAAPGYKLVDDSDLRQTLNFP